MDNLKELREINDIEIYLNKIQEIKDECYIFFVVKDTPGNCMPTDILNKIHDLGFISFSNELWRMYIGVRQSGHIIIDYVAGECEEPLNRKIQSKESTNIIELYSESWRNGNKCGVRINGIECSLNKRGINLVIYDDKCESVIDAIRFDSHDKNFIFERKPEVELLSNKIRWLSEKHHYDVCVTGVWYGANYGSILNGYSTYKILSSMGKSVLMLHKTKSPVHDAELRLDNHNVKFYNTYYPKDSISPVFTYEELEILNDYCDCFCSGSDQIWNYNVSFDGNMYLPFVHENRWKISLASSFGSFLLVGDLSFFYDMNSIWNKPLKKNMRILLVNNNGTGLLRGHNLSAVSSVHNTSAEGWVKSTGFDYISAHTKEEYKQKLKYFLSNESEKALFFEVFCE